jgi:hypothetical protein
VPQDDKEEGCGELVEDGLVRARSPEDDEDVGAADGEFEPVVTRVRRIGRGGGHGGEGKNRHNGRS